MFIAVGAGEIIYSICNQAAVADVLNNQKLVRGVQGGGFLEKSPPGRRRQEIDENIDSKTPLSLVSPNGDEVLQAGEKFLITWKSSSEVEKVKLEYSPDNGTTYLPIAVDVANIGHHEWLVPHHISSHCLIRVSEVKERKIPPHGLVYEMDFRVNMAGFSGSGDAFTIYLGDAADESIKNNLPGVSFVYEFNGKVYIHLEDAVKEIGRFTSFNDRWHRIQIFMDNVYDRISVILDGKLVFENIPRSPMAYFSPALSIAVGSGNGKEVEIDNVSVSAFYSLEDKRQWITLFNDDFEQLKKKNGMENSGWRTKSEHILECNQKETEVKHLSIKPCEGEQVTVVKTFNVPVDFPFDISDKTFEIRYNEDMYTDSAANDISPRHGGNSASANNFYSSSSTTLNRAPGISRTAEMFNTYYIYTFDGKLLAEYDHNGNCVRDYIYFGNRLLAEYKPQTNEYFYYMTDQINSTRIITDGSGNVVSSEAYGPYGDVQKTWVNTYNPKLKFSGKEREGYSDLDYFGARYYDHKSFRFNSVDPVINKKEALFNPQLWNLYAYCNNNPITYYDPDGRLIFLLPWVLNPATIAAITAAAAGGAILTHKVIKSMDITDKDVVDGIKVGMEVAAPWVVIAAEELTSLFGKDTKSGGASKEEKEYKRSISGENEKQAAKDVPSWAKGKRPYKGESGKDFAKRLMDEKYGKGNYEKYPGGEFNKIKKWGDRAFK